MHPLENIRSSSSHHLDGRRIVLGVTGSIGAVKCVELAREMARHGADVVPVMSRAATKILHPNALQFATGHRPILALTGDVEHVALLGDVPERADLLLVAPATANTVSKIAMGIDDSTVTTCATVALGAGTPMMIAPAMHEAMEQHPRVQEHIRYLRERGVGWVEPLREEKKSKLADVVAIAEEVIYLLAQGTGPDATPGPLAGRRALIISGATTEIIDPVRILTNRSSGQSGIHIATELRRLGAEVELWQGHATAPTPEHLRPHTNHYRTHDELGRLVDQKGLERFHQIWMPAAIGDYAPKPAQKKVESGKDGWALAMEPLGKIIEQVRKGAPKTTLVAFKTESDPDRLQQRARKRLQQYQADWIAANNADAMGADETTIHLIHRDGSQHDFTGTKQEVLSNVVAAVAASGESRTEEVVA